MALLGGCAKVKANDPHAADRARADAKSHQAACASQAAYDKLKSRLFDDAIARRHGQRENLDTLADYSLARVEEPLVVAWDPSLEVTRCKGRFILAVPPGAERAFAGDRALEAPIDYSAQVAADGSGLVYRVEGAESVVTRLAGFNLTAQTFRPPPAIDEPTQGPSQSPAAIASARPSVPAEVTRVAVPPVRPTAVAAARPQVRPSEPDLASRTATTNPRQRPLPAPVAERDEPLSGSSGEATIRAFYGALGAGDGVGASARVVPEKRASRTYSPGAMSRFYGSLAEPIRLTEVTPAGGGAYRVRYRYSAGRSHCNGSAVVSVTQRDGRDLIRSIRALSGC